MQSIFMFIATDSTFHTLVGLIYLLIVFLLFYCRKNVFFTSDQPPELLHFSPKNRSSAILGTAEVKTGLYIKSFPMFELVQNKFVLDALIWFKFNPSLVRLDVIDKFSFERCTALTKSPPEIHQEQDLLVVSYNIKVEFSNNLNYVLFPLDDHRLYIVLNNEHVTPDEMVFTVQENHFGCSDKLHTDDWRILKKTVESGYSEIALDHSKDKKSLYPRVVYSIDLALSGLRKAALIFIPILLISLTGTVSLILDLDVYDRAILSLSLGSLTGLLAYRFVIEKISPKVGYFTMAEIFYTIALAISFITFLINFLRMLHSADSRIVFYVATLWYLSIKLIMTFTVLYLLYLWKPLQKKEVSLDKELKATKPKLYKEYLSHFTLENLIRYTRKTNEFPNPSNSNWNNPDYSKANASQARCVVCNNLLSIATLHQYNRNIIFFPELFVGMLTEFLERPDMQQDPILNFTIQKDTQFVVFGDLYGAFHSLVRDLVKLKSLDLIDNELKIKKPNCFLIFNGNVVDGSPFILETLTVVIALLLRNPGRVFYLKGPHEDHQLWHSYQTYTELKIKTEHIFKQASKALFNYMDLFFKKLPSTIYLEDKDHQFLRISHFKLNEEQNNSAFEEDVIVMIQGLKRSITYQISTGLELLTPEKGICKWSMLSCPTRSFKNLYNFSKDTFLIIKSHKNMKQWTMRLYSQDVEQLSGYSEYNFNLVYGMKLEEHNGGNKINYKKEIVIGSTLDLSKTSAVLGERLYQGLNLSITQKNARGGIRHAPIRHIVLDDQYTPYIAKKNVEQLMQQYHTNLILSPVGTPTMEAYLPLIKKQQILVMFPLSGATIFRHPSLTNTIHLRTSYATEAKVLIQYAVEALGIRRFVLFYQDDSYGLASLEGARDVLHSYNIKDFLETSYQRSNPNIDACADEITKFNPSAIFFFSTHVPSRALVKELGVSKLTDIKLFGVSFLTDVFRKFLNEKGLQLIISRVMPDINAIHLPLVREYHAALEENFFDGVPSEDSLEGYIDASLLMTVLESIKPPYTNEKIIAEFEAMKNFNFKGMLLNFDPMTRELYKEVWIDTGS